MMLLLLRWVAAIVLAFFIGKLVSKLKLPSILGWLVAGMILGPHALKLVPQTLMDGAGYQAIVHVLECAVGLMIGTELVWSRMKKYGKALIITTLTQSLGTLVLVSAVFAIVFAVSGIPIYLAFIFGGIALATAPAPALSIVREFQTNGPVTKTLIPMAALDDMVGVVVFFTTIAIVARKVTGGGMPIYMIPVMIFLPLLIGAVTGVPAGFLLKKERSKPMTLFILVGMILVTAFIGFICNTYLMKSPLLNFMLMGMAFSAAFSNLVTEERLEQIVRDFNPILSGSMVIVILNLGAPLDYHAILGAGLFTFIYIVSRALGKYYGARLGAKATGLPDTVQKYLGFTLLPHSGVSLVFTGIAVSVLAAPAPECAKIIQGTIAAAAVINEVIAVITAKKGFEWAGEFHGDNSNLQGRNT
jgi:NhaP-type Na+/H+ or K+/H+ antiporter